jgi:tetratricopeptide (TPR) repeat protein
VPNRNPPLWNGRMILAPSEPCPGPSRAAGHDRGGTHKLRRGVRWFPVWAIVFAAGSMLPRLASARATSEAAAEPCPAPSEADTEAAKTAFREGQAAFSEGAYSHAVELWKEAYDLDCSAHALLLNLAMAQELLGRPEDAARTLELFNRRVPESPYAEPNRKRIERLRRLWVEQSRARARERHERPAPPPPRPAPPPPLDTNVVALAIAAGGGLMALAGGALYIEGRAAAASASERCGESPGSCPDAAAVIAGERARERAEVAGWMAGTGLFAAAAGTLWYLLTPPAPADGGLELGTSVSSTGMSIQLSGSY